jgi:hypothetical protein
MQAIIAPTVTGVFSTKNSISAMAAPEHARAMASLSLHVHFSDSFSMPAILQPDTGQCRELFVIQVV